MSSGTADALGLSRAILCNGEIFMIRLFVCLDPGDLKLLVLQMGWSKGWRSWRKLQSCIKVKISESETLSEEEETSAVSLCRADGAHQEAAQGLL